MLGKLKQVLALLKRTDFFIQKNGRTKGKKLSVAVLTGYGEQKQRLRTAIQARKHEWKAIRKSSSMWWMPSRDARQTW
jgi:hypothetical protein